MGTIDCGMWLPLLEASDYTIAREVLLGGVTALYFTAFLATFNQFPALLRERGLSPAPEFIERTSPRDAPSFVRWRLTPYSDRLLRVVCLLGMVLSLFGVTFLGTPEVAPPFQILLFLRWTVFRVEFGVGMIKMRGDTSWRDFTAMNYPSHQTQSMPNPLSRWAHQKPQWWHRTETLGSHVCG